MTPRGLSHGLGFGMFVVKPHHLESRAAWKFQFSLESNKMVLTRSVFMGILSTGKALETRQRHARAWNCQSEKDLSKSSGAFGVKISDFEESDCWHLELEAGSTKCCRALIREGKKTFCY